MPITPEQLKMIADASANLPTFKRIPRAELEKIIAEEWDADEKEQAEFESGGMSSRFEGQTVNPQAPAEREARRQDALAKAEQGRRELEQMEKGDDFFSKDTWTGIKSGLGGGGFMSADSEGIAPGVAGVYNAASDLFGEKPLSQLYIEGRDQFRDEVAAAKENPNFYAGQAIGGIAPALMPVGTGAGAASKGSGILASAGKGALMGGAQGAVSGALTPGERGKLDSMKSTLGDAAVGGAMGAAVGGAFGGLSGLNTKAKEVGGIVPLLKQNANALADFAESPKSGRQIVGGWLRKFAGDQASEDFVPSADDFFKPTQAPSFKEMDAFKKAQSVQQTPKPPKGGSVVQYDDLSSSTAQPLKPAPIKSRAQYQQPNVQFETKTPQNPDDIFIKRGLTDELETPQNLPATKGEIDVGPPQTPRLSPTDEIRQQELMERLTSPGDPILKDRAAQFSHQYPDDAGMTFLAQDSKVRPSSRDFFIPSQNQGDSPFLLGADKFGGEYQSIAPNLGVSGKRGGYTNPFEDFGITQKPVDISAKPLGPEQPTFKQLEAFERAKAKAGLFEKEFNPVVEAPPPAPRPAPVPDKAAAVEKAAAQLAETAPPAPRVKEPAPPPKQHGGDRSKFSEQVFGKKEPKANTKTFVDFYDSEGGHIANLEIPTGLDQQGKRAYLKQWADGIKKAHGYDPLDGEDLNNITISQTAGKETSISRKAQEVSKERTSGYKKRGLSIDEWKAKKAK